MDLPGFGNEKLISSDWGIKEYAQWVAKKIKKNNLNSIVLVGHSFGGKIAAQVAIDHPELVKKLILVAAPLLYMPPLKIRLKIVLHKVGKRLFPKKRSITKNMEYKEAIEKGLGEVFKKSVNYDMTKQLPEIKCPTLIIWGSKDKTAPIAIGQKMHSLIKHSRFEEIQNSGHNIQFENPNLLWGLINKFI